MSLPTINRELSWLLFNDRVLEEADKVTHPLFERCRFLGITASNLDEFFMIRVGSMFDLKVINPDAIDEKTGMSLDAQLKAIFSTTKAHLQRRESTYENIWEALLKYKVKALAVDKWSSVEKDHFHSVFNQDLLPLLNLQVIDPKHPFPHLINQQIYLALRFKHKEKIKEAILSFPTDRISLTVSLPLIQQFKYALTEDVIWAYADQLVPGQIIEKCLLRVTRNADLDTEVSEEDDIDFRSVMKQLLKKRDRLQPVRMEVRFPISDEFKTSLLKRLKLHQRQFFHLESPLDYRFLIDIEHFLLSRKVDCFFPRHVPAWPNALHRTEPLIPQILNKDVLFTTPYQSLEPIVLLLREAASDPKVSAIRITLYRVASDGRILHELIQAAENKKDVLVVLELKARFDEANNISWSSKLESAGCRVIYGMDLYKVHSKIALILRHDKGKLQTITHVATGNYNEKTAKIYTDAHLLSADQKLGNEAQTFFNTLQTGIIDDKWSGQFDVLAVSPHGIKYRIIAMIEQEILHHLQYGNGRLIFKVNSLTDLEIINALIKASQAGVKIDLIVRGICCLVPGIIGQTENITVTSLVGRFLEHSRYYYANNNDQTIIYLSSADLMTRNMSKRIELAVRLTDPNLIKDIINQLDIILRDTSNARTMDSNMRYSPKEGSLHNSHTELIELYQSIEVASSKNPKKRHISDWLSLFKRR